MHVWAKFMVLGAQAVADERRSQSAASSLPLPFAYLIMFVELVGGICVVIGFTDAYRLHAVSD